MDGSQIRDVSAFLSTSGFALSGAVMTDLDGTAVVKRGGRTTIGTEVEFGSSVSAISGGRWRSTPCAPRAT